jgi:hypothetical protein
MGKANISTNEVDIIKKIKANEKKQAGRNRADFAGVTTVSKSLGGNQGSGSGGSASTSSGTSSGWVDTATSDLNMGDYDITTVDRLKFSATGTDNLITTDYGIATDSTDSDKLHYNVPTGKEHKIDIAGTNIITVNASTVTVQQALSVQSSLTVTGTISFTGASQTLGNSSADTLTITAHIGAAIDMNTEDLELVDRLKFSSLGTDNLAVSDYGIATDSTDADNLHYNVPAGKQHEFDIGGTNLITVNSVAGTTLQTSCFVNGSLTATGTVSFNGNTTIGNSSGDSVTITGTLGAQLRMGGNKVTNLGTPTLSTDAATKAYVDSGGGSTSFIGFTGDDILDMANFDIERVGQIEFSTTSHNIKSNSVGFEYRVPVGDTHEFFVNGQSRLLINNLGIDLGGVSISNVLITDTQTITVASSLSSTGFNQFGNAASDSTHLYGLLDFKANTSGTNQTLPASSDGYINIKVGGVAKKLYYY